PLLSCPAVFLVLASSAHTLLPPAPPPHIYPLSLHDALPISTSAKSRSGLSTPVDRNDQITTVLAPRNGQVMRRSAEKQVTACARDRKSTRLNSSHQIISYAVFCLKKKKKKKKKKSQINNNIK